jgi:AbrB family looped-hinge helix DNA binding protein
MPDFQAQCLFRHWENFSIMESAKVGKRGAVIVPARLRKRFGIEEGTLVTAEETEDGILIRPAVVVPVERYSPERKAEFLLSTATSPSDYRRARKEVQKLGLDPDSVPHQRP